MKQGLGYKKSPDTVNRAEQAINWQLYAEALEEHIAWYERWAFGWMAIAIVSTVTALAMIING